MRRAACSQPTVCSPCVGEMALEPGLELLEDARDGEEPGRLDGRQVGDDLARVRARRHREAEHQRQVVVRVALGDVRGGQPRDHLGPLGELDHVPRHARRGHDVAVHELHALRRAGRAGGVDQRQHVLGVDRPPVRLGVEIRIRALDLVPADGALAPCPLEHDHRLQRRELGPRRQEPLDERLLDDRHARLGVADDERDLLRRVRRVDRERRRAQRHHREVGDVELRPVAQHQRHAVAARDAALRQPAGERVDAIAQLRPGEADLVFLRADRHAVGVFLDRDPERLGHRAGAERAARGRGGGLLPHGGAGYRGGAAFSAPGSPRRSAGRCRCSARSRTGRSRARSR